jgi:uncharacterized lipoprotein YddW (UPF0748 family)
VTSLRCAPAVALALLALTSAAVLAGPTTPPAGRPAPAGPAGPPGPPIAASPIPSPAASAVAALDPPELRAVWVDAFHDGIKTPQQVDDLVAWARQANLNALFVQVRRRGDAYYLQSLEPPAEDPDLQPGFDALAYLIQRAHDGPQRLQVHAWVATLPIWGKRDTPPLDPNHVFNRHGLDDGSGSTWLMLRDDGAAWAGGPSGGMYYLDPGHPDAARYTADVALTIVRRYDVDGIHLDQVRYFEGDPRHWGYNPTSVARFDQRFGRDPTTQPDPDDPDWAAWRRQQVTDLVRRVYLETKALKPNVAVTAAVVGWGKGPDATVDGWQRTAPYSVVFQDWEGWLKAGIVDYLLAMDYYHEDEREAGWFDNWATWQQANLGGRAVAIGVGSYLNELAGAQAQLQRARALRPLGIALYSFAVPFAGADNRGADARQQSAAWLRQLFPRPAPVPELAWLARPALGQVLVEVPGHEAATVRLDGPSPRQWQTDGTGLAGDTGLPPGDYRVSVQAPGVDPTPIAVHIDPGRTSVVRAAR